MHPHSLYPYNRKEERVLYLENTDCTIAMSCNTRWRTTEKPCKHRNVTGAPKQQRASIQKPYCQNQYLVGAPRAEITAWRRSRTELYRETK